MFGAQPEQKTFPDSNVWRQPGETCGGSPTGGEPGALVLAVNHSKLKLLYPSALPGVGERLGSERGCLDRTVDFNVWRPTRGMT